MDSHHQLYNPDETLIMSYAHNKCRTRFSEQQGFSMQKMILQLSAILQACIIKSDFVGLIISNNTEWSTANTPNNGNLWIEGNLEIKAGATLTINSDVTVHFSKNSKLIIEPNARLILYGTLTSRGCSGYAWQGVKVFGSGPDKSQYPTSGQYWQGRIDCRPGSLIENAITGVQLFGPTENLTGGQIRCSGATIKNCTRGVQFKPYKNFWPFAGSQQGQPRNYFGSFSRTHFITDYNYDVYQFNTNFFAFMDMSGVDGVSIAGCTFKNEKNYRTDQQFSGCGIFASDAGFTVIPAGNISNLPADYAASEFNGLGRGIHAINMEINHPYIVKEATFNNCYYGIRNDGVSGATLLFNNFNLGKVPWAETDEEEGPTDQIGILFENDIAGFTCEENNFTRVNGQPEVLTIGINSINTGEMNKNIRRNTFTGLHIGNLANQKNAFVNPPGTQSPIIRGLNYDCNKNFNVAGFGAQNGLDFSVPNGLIRPEQGLGNFLPNNEIVYSSAGNRFSYTGVDFSNFGNGIKYHWSPSNVNEKPITINGVVNIEQSQGNGCTQSYCYPPCKNDTELNAIKSDFYLRRAALSTLNVVGVALTTQQKTTRAYYQQVMDQNAFLVAHHIMYDTTHYNQDSLRTWVSNMNSMEGDLWLAKDYLSSGLLQQANNILNAMPTQRQLNAEQQVTITNVKSISAALIGQDPNNLSETALQTIKSFADGANDYARGWARRLLTRNGWYFAPEYIKYGYGNEERNAPADVADKREIIRVQPNPASDYVMFAFPNATTADGILRIFDLNGHPVSVFSGLQGETGITWNTTDVASGIFYYHFTSNGNSVSGTILLNK